jgi:hypothetical protein
MISPARFNCPASPVTGHAAGDAKGLQVTPVMALTELAVTWPINLLRGA